MRVGGTSTVTVNAPPANASLTGGTLSCAVTSLTLTAFASGTNAYTFSAGATQIGSSNQAVVSQPGVYTVTIANAGGCTTTASATVVQTIGTALTWTGITSSDWNTASNWCPNRVPTATDNVVIATGPTNQPVLSTTAVAQSVEVQIDASLSITAGGSLTINGSKSAGGSTTAFYNRGTVTNRGQLLIGNTASAGSVGLFNLASFINAPGGVISIDRTSGQGLYNAAGSFTNAARITIGNVASAGQTGLYNGAAFINNPGGIISVNRASYTGLTSTNSFTNAAQISIGNVAAVGQTGLYNTGSFGNNPGGVISIDRATADGLSNANDGRFINAAQLTIGGIDATGNYGLSNLGSFTNTTGGSIAIDRTSAIGLVNENNFINTARITLGAAAPVGFYGLVNRATFNNTGCDARINVVANTAITDASGGTLTNSGTIIENTSENCFIVNNSGLVRNLGGGNFTIRTNTGVLTTTPGGSGISITASPSLTITQGQNATLTASGATAYSWSSGQTTPAISVSLAGTYSVTGTLGNCASETTVTVIVLTMVPDLTPTLYARPSSANGTTPVAVVVAVENLSTASTSGLITVRITKDSRLQLTLPAEATQLDGRDISNRAWNLTSTNSLYYILTTSQVIDAEGSLSLGLTGVLTPGATTGSVIVSAVIEGGSGQEARANNNTSSNRIDYFQQ